MNNARKLTLLDWAMARAWAAKRVSVNVGNEPASAMIDAELEDLRQWQEELGRPPNEEAQ